MEFIDLDFLQDESIILKLTYLTEEVPEDGLVPAYYFNICLKDDDSTIIGTCDLRVGHNENTYIGGNIGYQIKEEYRGNGYSKKACLLLFELARRNHMTYVIITTDPENRGSYKTCESLGCELVEFKDVPHFHPLYKINGQEKVRIYRHKLF